MALEALGEDIARISLPISVGGLPLNNLIECRLLRSCHKQAHNGSESVFDIRQGLFIFLIYGKPYDSLLLPLKERLT